MRTMVLLLVCTTPLHAAEPALTPLPSPLTLDYALSLADDPDPGLQQRLAELERRQADLVAIDASQDFSAYLEARARYVQPPKISLDQSHDDNRIGIVVDKDIYDFGKHSAQVNAVNYEVQASQLQYLDGRSRRRLEIMQRYFAVLLSDLLFNRYNEEMATTYVSYDKLNKRKELGQISALQVLEAEAKYQRIRILRYQSQAEQRHSRARLAEVLNRPNQLPENIDAPSLQPLTRAIPDYEKSIAAALQQNHLIQALRAKVSAAEEYVQAARSQYNPTLKGSAEAYNYSRELSANDEMRIGVTLNVPLYTGRRSDAAVAQALAQLHTARAQLQQAESEMRQTVLRLCLDIENLKAQREEMTVLRKYRELNLDRSRALYEMEVNTDLGDSMVMISDLEYQTAQTNYKMLHAWLQLDILTGSYILPGETNTSATVTNHEQH